MTSRMAVSGIAIMLLVGVAAYAAVDPDTLEQIPEGQKHSRRQIARMMARQVSPEKEQRLADAVAKAREDYLKSLEELRDYYKKQANARGLRMADAELEDVSIARHFVYVRWEDKLAEVSATREDPDANKLLAEADKLRKGFSPFGRAGRRRKAARLYEEIIQKHPKSAAVDSAAYGLAEVYRSGSFGEYRRAVRFYEMCYLANPNTKHDALFKAAQVCDTDLTDYENAARYYWMASKLGVTGYSRQYSRMRLKQLREKGFGASLAEEEKPEK